MDSGWLEVCPKLGRLTELEAGALATVRALQDFEQQASQDQPRNVLHVLPISDETLVSNTLVV